MLRHYGVNVRRNVLEVLLLFALNPDLRRRIIDNQAVEDSSKDTGEAIVWMTRFDRQLKALVENNEIETTERDGEQSFKLLNEAGLDSDLAKALNAGVEESVQAFDIINEKRGIEELDRAEADARINRFVGEGEHASLNTV